MMEIQVEIPAMDIVLADQPGFIGLVDRGLQALAFAHEFAADVDVARVRGHGRAGIEAALDQQMRVVPHDLAVLAGAGLGLVGIDDEIVRPVANLLGHERPFQAGRKARATAPALARRLHLVDQPVAAFFEKRLGAVPGAARARAFEAPVVLAVEIEEDAVLVGEHHVLELSPSGVGIGLRAWSAGRRSGARRAARLDPAAPRLAASTAAGGVRPCDRPGFSRNSRA